MNITSKIFWLRLIAILEGISFLALGITMPLKYMYEMPQPNYIVGMAHGFLFMVYVFMVLYVYSKQDWKFKHLFWSLFASVVPVGTFVADHKFFRHLDK